MNDKTWGDFLKDSGFDVSIKYEQERVIKGSTPVLHLDEICITPDFLLEVAKTRPIALRGMHVKYFTFDVCMAAIKTQVNFVGWIPEAALTKEMVNLAVETNPAMIYEVSERYLSDDVIELAAHSAVYALRLVRNPERQTEIALQNPSLGLDLLFYVSKEQQTSDFIKEVFASTAGHSISDSDILPLVDEKYLTERALIFLVARKPSAYLSIPETMLTEKIALAATGQGFSDLAKIPREHINDEVVSRAVYSNANAVANVPSDLLTQETCEYAAENAAGKLRLSSVPMEYRSKKVCLDSFRFNVGGVQHNFEHLPPELKGDYKFLIQLGRVNQKVIPLIKAECFS